MQQHNLTRKDKAILGYYRGRDDCGRQQRISMIKTSFEPSIHTVNAGQARAMPRGHRADQDLYPDITRLVQVMVGHGKAEPGMCTT